MARLDVLESDWAEEHFIDLNHVPAKCCRPKRFKSWLAIELFGWSADIKLDYDFKRIRPKDGRVRKSSKNRPSKKLFDAVLKKYDWLSFYQAFAYSTRRGLHVRAWARPDKRLTQSKILEIQRALNDDPKRCDMNDERVRRGVIGASCLWNFKVVNGQVVSKEERNEEWTSKIQKWLRVSGPK